MQSRRSKILRADPDVFGTFAVPGFSLSGGSSSNYGLVFAPLKPIDERKGKGHAAADIVARVSPKLFGIPGAIVVAFEPPAIQRHRQLRRIPVRAAGSGTQYSAGPRHRRAQNRRRPAASVKILQGLFTSYTANDPQQLVQIDREKAKAIGVPISQVTQALGVYMGSQYVNDFDFNNRSYRVYVQADQPFRMNARDLRQYYVRSDTNGLVPLDNIVSLTETSGPQVINHFNLFRSAEIDGAAAPGYSSGQGLKAMEDLAKQNMLQGMSYSWSGLALEEVEASGKAIIIFGLGLAGRVPHAFGAVREFRAAVHHLARCSHGRAGRAAVRLRARLGGRRLRANWIGAADRSVGQELDFDCGVCRAVDRAGPLHHRGRHRSSRTALAAHPDDVVCLHPGRAAALLRQRRRQTGRHSVGTAIVGGMLFSTVLNLIFIPVLYVIVKTILTSSRSTKEVEVTSDKVSAA